MLHVREGRKEKVPSSIHLCAVTSGEKKEGEEEQEMKCSLRTAAVVIVLEARVAISYFTINSF